MKENSDCIECDIDKPVVIGYYHDRLRSPSATDLIKRMRDRSRAGISPIWVEAVTDTPSGITLDRVVEKRKCGIPDVVWDYFGAFTGALHSEEYINEHDIKYVPTITDVEVHTMEMGNFGDGVNTHLDAHTLHWPGVRDTPAVDRMYRCFEDLITREGAKLECIPFGVDTDKFKPGPKVYDIAAVYTMSDMNPFQGARTYLAKKVAALIAPSKEHGPPRYSGVVGNRYQEHYVEVCRGSRMAVVDTSMRDYMTAKYLEFGAAGALLLGEKPTGSYGLFDEDTCRLRSLDAAVVNLEQDMAYFKDNPQLTEKLTQNLRKRIVETYALDIIADRMERMFYLIAND